VCDLYTTGYQTEEFVACGNTWTAGVCYPTVISNANIGSPGNYFAEFSTYSSTVATPEPGTGMLTLLLGVGLFVAVRKRNARSFPVA